MSPGPLTVHNAEITTAAVEVKTLTLKGKQVTLAVFRQIQDANLFDEEYNLLGNPWGTVNYHVGCSIGAHYHVVWQYGAELRRAIVRDPSAELTRRRSLLSDSAGRWWRLRELTLASRAEIDDPSGADADCWFDARGWPHVGLHGWDIPIDEDWISRTRESAARALTPGSGNYWARYKDDYPTYSYSLKPPIPLVPDLKVVASAYDEMTTNLRLYAAATSKAPSRWQEVQSLPQLFIAV